MTTITTTKIPSRRRRATATGRVPVEDAEPIAMRGPTLALDIGPGDVHTDATAKGVWLMIARPGEYHKAPVGDFALTKETTFPEILHNWERDGRKPVPVDYEHQGERADLTGPTPACGWITDIKVDAGNLMAFVQWLPEARDLIRRGAYRGISPAILLRSKDRHGRERGAVLKSCGLTNTPFLDLPQVQAKDWVPVDVEALRRAQSIEDEREGAARKVAREQTAKPLPEPRDDGDDDGAALRGEIASVKKMLASERRRRRDAEARSRDLEAELAERDAVDVSARVDAAIGAWDLKADRGALIALCRADRASFEQAYPAIPLHQRHLLGTIATGNHNVPLPAAAALTMSDRAPTKIPTIDEQVSSVIALAKSRGIDMHRDEAFAVAAEQLRRMRAGGTFA